MSDNRETDPHFLPPLQQHPPHDQVPHLHPQPDPNRRPPHLHQPRRHRKNENFQPILTPTQHYPPSSPPPPPHQTPHPHSQSHHTPTPYVPTPQHQTQTPLTHHGPETHFPLHQPPHHSTWPPIQPPHPSSNVRIPHRRKTGPHTWLIGAFCAVFWITVFLGGVVVLIVYLIFRPRGPKFDISSASLNAAYLDVGYLNADMTLLVNFTNPSKKATVDFNYMVVNLYYGNTPISTTYVDPFKAMKTESVFRNVHLVSSQVLLPLRETQQMRQQIEGNRLRFEVKGLLRTRSNLGGLFRYSYWLYGHCIIEVTGPPSGVLVGKKCSTKR